MEQTADARRKPVLFVLRALKLGDLLVAVPALHGLRRAYPDHRLVLGAPGWLDPIVRLVGGIDALVPTPGLDDPIRLEPGITDIAVNMHGNGRESRALIAQLDARLRFQHAGSDESGEWPDRDQGEPRWLDGIHERARWVRLVRAFGVPADENEVAIGRPAAPPPVASATVLHVGAFYGSRRWPADRFADVARELGLRGHRVVLTGGVAERERAERIARLADLPGDAVLAGHTDLAQLAAVVASARLVVSADTGAAHLASAYATPSVVLFGPAPPEEWGPPPGPHRVLTDARLRRGDAFSADPDPALLAVGVAQVLEAVRELDG